MSGVFSRFRFRSPKLVRNPSPRAVLATSGAKRLLQLIFSNRMTQSTLFHPKLMSGVFSQFRFGSPKLMRNLTARAARATCGAKKVAVDFSELNAPNSPRLTQNSCLVCFRNFGFGLQNSCKTRPRGPFGLHQERKKLQLIFSNRTHPIHPV